MKRGLAGITIFMLMIAFLAIYLGLEIMSIGDEVSGTGGAFGAELAALGGLWSVMGVVLILLSILTFITALGFAGLKEWGRKNGTYAVYFIGAICTVAGLLIAYFSIIDSVLYFGVTVMALVCGQILRDKRGLFELGTGPPRKGEAAPTYREVRHAKKNVVMRHPRTEAVGPKKQPVKCGRCGTINDADRTHCKMCAREL